MVKVAKVKRDLLDAGFVRNPVKAPHGYIYFHPDGRSTTLKENYKNGNIPAGTLAAISSQTGLRFR
jgi:predicted RNA binding protein YcfA (HicA-like mRNA interferase family)